MDREKKNYANVVTFKVYLNLKSHVLYHIVCPTLDNFLFDES